MFCSQLHHHHHNILSLTLDCVWLFHETRQHLHFMSLLALPTSSYIKPPNHKFLFHFFLPLSLWLSSPGHSNKNLLLLLCRTKFHIFFSSKLVPTLSLDPESTWRIERCVVRPQTTLLNIQEEKKVFQVLEPARQVEEIDTFSSQFSLFAFTSLCSLWL